MNWLEFKEENCETMIKFHKKWIMTHRAVTYLNILLAIWNGYILYHQNPFHLFTALCTGAIIGNCFWLVTQLLEMKQDLNLDKQRLARIKEMQDKNEYADAVKNFRREKEYYEDLIKFHDVKDKIPI